MLAFAVILSTSLCAADWARFRGPNGSGVADDATGIPAQFGKAAWRTAVPFGRSSPVLAGSTLFLTASERGTLITLSLDARTGAIRWRRELKPRHRHEIYPSNDAASPTPVTDGANLYAFFADFGLVSYDGGGRLRWTLPLGPFENFYGMAGSPILAGSTLLLVCDQRKESYLLAVDKDTGRVRWKADRSYVKLEAYATPILRGGQVIVHGSSRVDAHSIATGERLWSTGGQGYNSKGTPVLWRDLLIASAPGSDAPIYPAFESLDLNHDGQLAREEFDKNEDLRGHFPTVDADHDGLASREEWAFTRNLGVGDYGMCGIRLDGSGTIAWRNKRSYPNVPSALVYRDVLYTVRSGGIVTSYDPATGEVRHSARAALGEYFASPVAGDGKLYVSSEEGKITVLKAGEKFETLAVNEVGETIYATPALAPGRIYLRTANAVHAFGSGHRAD